MFTIAGGHDLISLAVVPVVIISACGLLCLTFHNRLTALVGRLRAIQRERISEYRLLFHLEEGSQAYKAKEEEIHHYLRLLDAQTVKILKRAFLVRNSMIALMLAIAAFILTSLLIGISVYFSVLSGFVVGLFVFGLLAILLAITLFVWELVLSLDPVRMESEFVQQLLRLELEAESGS